MSSDDRDPTDLGLPRFPAAHECVDGWLDMDTDNPRPCPSCRPHLRRITDANTGLIAWRASGAPDTPRKHQAVR